MVRFKYRHLLVEFLDPTSLSPLPSFASAPPPPDLVEGEEWEGEEELARIPDLPFVLPLDPTQPLLGDEGASAVYKAVRAMCQSVFGDEGWGRVSSSFKGESSERGSVSRLSCGSGGNSARCANSSVLPLAPHDTHDPPCRAPTLPPPLGCHHSPHHCRRGCSTAARGGRQWDDQEAPGGCDCASPPCDGCGCRCPAQGG